MTTPHTQDETIPVTLARLEGKIDAALATQTARLDEHSRRLDVVDTRLNAHSARHDEHARAIAALPPPVTTQKASGWTIAGTIIGAVVGLGSLLAVLITLIRVIPHAVG